MHVIKKFKIKDGHNEGILSLSKEMKTMENLENMEIKGIRSEMKNVPSGIN